ncbi:MopE-related protein [Sorangium sp. So ce861]|uniref:putative metal-binding motif-containing protein n=1 Tax=Sorangium sp. So ce861 TaxID=3133323 RepID=UPI003F60FBE9
MLLLGGARAAQAQECQSQVNDSNSGGMHVQHDEAFAAHEAKEFSDIISRTFALRPTDDRATVTSIIEVDEGFVGLGFPAAPPLSWAGHARAHLEMRVFVDDSEVLCTSSRMIGQQHCEVFCAGWIDDETEEGSIALPSCHVEFPRGSSTMRVDLVAYSDISFGGTAEGHVAIHGNPDSVSILNCTPNEDSDSDGFPLFEDCNDLDSSVHPGASESCDGRDNDCDGAVDDGFFTDEDGDGFGGSGGPIGDCDLAVTTGGDCDDERADVSPGRVEACDDGIDNNCDGLVDDVSTTPRWFADADGDGLGSPDASSAACVMPDGFAGNADDCDDTNPDPELNLENSLAVCDDSPRDSCHTTGDDGVLVDGPGGASACFQGEVTSPGTVEFIDDPSCSSFPAGVITSTVRCVRVTSDAESTGGIEVCVDNPNAPRFVNLLHCKVREAAQCPAADSRGRALVNDDTDPTCCYAIRGATDDPICGVVDDFSWFVVAESGDLDEDLVPDEFDNCPADENLFQQDSDGDGVGDVCDNCPLVSNPSQQDGDGDGAGDACSGGAGPEDTCCEAGSSPGCSDGGVAACVCGADPYCCDVAWDGLCADEVVSLGCGTCGDPSGPSLPDIRVLSSMVPSCAEPGQDIGSGMSLVVQNAGTGSAGSFFVGWYLSADQALGSGDPLLIGGRDSVSALAPGQSLALGIGVNRVPAGTAPGQYFLLVLLDELEAQAESVEDNNLAAFPLSIQASCGD